MKTQLKNALLNICPNETVVLMDGHLRWEVKRGEYEDKFVCVGMQGFNPVKYPYDFDEFRQDKETDNIIQGMKDQEFSIVTAGLTY
ncbi:hypothetical protein [Priestia megaterium]|uniref:hypothetical protein n=1 Tax=Priestia megaterium TaxID=1404 RepID=UPI002877EB76|nr:hypothetical protein [Priestia megaterium]